MLERIGEKLQRVIILVLFTSASLGGCTSATQSSLTFFADPAKYEFSSCQSLAGQRKQWEKRQQDLKLLMDKAERSAGGGVVNVLAYQLLKVSTYAAVAAESCVPENFGRTVLLSSLS
jgi:hypothetical protein